ncbi:hypothetical protein B0A67_07290 [Flavobacterium aquidurense]|uniref:hypothetical protein n=1 Tax=Flavobacterium aquidurense TaxID=362413 RepID=UPI00091209D5|nr:hypothetical protein [Flavobacterium aquidurense]OXA72338.1 hypothetical protein B0A67_07290 [Flavobacterium aquidurense]SHG44100.1 hypothetical protein SAMN05444481_104233 [Flavobacterium frigidimaris]
MKRRSVFLVILILFSRFVMAQESKTDYQKLVKKFIENIKSDNKEAIGDWVVYPLKREYPIPDVTEKADFIKRYSEIFDATLKNEIIKSTPSKGWTEMGLRGVMLNHGSIWLDIEGRLTAVNYQSKAETELRNKIISSQKKALDPSIAFFQTPICILETSKFKIRIDNLGKNNYRFASWSIEKEMTEKPDLVLNGGELVVEGIGGNHQYEFKKDNYTYECAIIVLGEKNSPPARLTIYEGGKVILSQDATIVSR